MRGECMAMQRPLGERFGFWPKAVSGAIWQTLESVARA